MSPNLRAPNLLSFYPKFISNFKVRISQLFFHIPKTLIWNIGSFKRSGNWVQLDLGFVVSDQREISVERMLAHGNADASWSEKKMEGDEGLRTVDCLRGRLLAERAASRVAKEEAEFMGNRLIELENRLKEEIKSRNRAEKKLRLLMGKLQILKIRYVSEESENGSSSDQNSEINCKSSTASSGEEPKSQIPNRSELQTSTTTECDHRNQNPATEDGSSSPTTAQEEKLKSSAGEKAWWE